MPEMTSSNLATERDAKIGALALIAGAAINMLRMIPIYAHKQVGFEDYPPHSVIETVNIAQLSGYYISHMMVFFATPLFMLGFYTLYKELKDTNPSKLLTLSLIGFFIGQLLYTLGVVIHGLVLPPMAHEYVVATAAEQLAMGPLFELNHKIATAFGGLGFAYLLISTGIMGVYMRTKFKALGVLAMLMGAFALIGYSFGVLDLTLFKSFNVTAGYVTLMFVFYLVVGGIMFRASARKT